MIKYASKNNDTYPWLRKIAYDLKIPPPQKKPKKQKARAIIHSCFLKLQKEPAGKSWVK